MYPIGLPRIVPLPRKQRRRFTLPLVALGLSILTAGLPRIVQAQPRGTLSSLGDVFAADMDDFLNRPLAAFEARGPAAFFGATFTRIEATGNGVTYTGFANGVDPAESGAQTTTVTARSTVEVYLPVNPDFTDPDTAWMLVWKTPVHIPGEPEPDGTRKRRIFARQLAKRGISTCLIFEHDRHPLLPGQPTDSVPVQLGYGASGGALSSAGLDWLMLKDPHVTPLVVEDFTRLWRNYGLAQMNILGATFALQLIRNEFGPAAQEWTDSIKLILAGGSKGVGAVTTAGAVDPRVAAVRFSGSQPFGEDEQGGQHRYETDWEECPDGQHRRAAFAKWAWDHRDVSPSFFDIQVAGRDPARYQDKLWIDVIGTHDWNAPLGSHSKFWSERDGLVNGVPDQSEERWNYRIIRRPNANHGISYKVGLHGNFCVEATDLLLWTTLKHLALGRELGRMEAVTLDTSRPDEWSLRVRVTDHARPLASEEYSVWVLLSDDRDTRRCSPPIQSTSGNCFDGSGFDDNREEEDKFLQIPASSVVADGEFRTLTFTPPAEFLAFSTTPIVAAFGELILRGPHGDRIIDDLWLHTTIVFDNDELYSPRSCP